MSKIEAICPNGHGPLSRIKEPLDVELLVPMEVLDFLMDREERRKLFPLSSELKPIVFPKLVNICLECGYVETVETGEEP